MNDHDHSHISFMAKRLRNGHFENPSAQIRFSTYGDHITPSMGVLPYESQGCQGGACVQSENVGQKAMGNFSGENKTNFRIKGGLLRFVDSA